MSRRGMRCWYVLDGRINYKESHAQLAIALDSTPVLMSEWFSRHPYQIGRYDKILIGDAEIIYKFRSSIANEIKRTTPKKQEEKPGKRLLLSNHEYHGTSMYRISV